jgi:hypothetical protein
MPSRRVVIGPFTRRRFPAIRFSSAKIGAQLRHFPLQAARRSSCSAMRNNSFSSCGAFWTRTEKWNKMRMMKTIAVSRIVAGG